jgi:hypothetical protein
VPPLFYLNDALQKILERQRTRLWRAAVEKTRRNGPHARRAELSVGHGHGDSPGGRKRSAEAKGDSPRLAHTLIACPPLHVVERGSGEGLSVAYMSLDTNRRRLCHLIGDAIALGRAGRGRETSGAAREGECG